MDTTFEDIISQVNNKKYRNVATTIYGAYKDKLSGTGESWTSKIEDKLKSIHQEKLSSGLFSLTQKEIAGETCAEVIDWLEKELGIERKEQSLAYRLGIT